MKRRTGDEDEIIRDGQGVRVPLMMMDSVQRALAADRSPTMTNRRNGYAFADSAEARTAKARAYDASKVRLQNAWKNGLDIGDTFAWGGRQVVADCSDDGRLVLRDASTLDGDARKQAAWEDAKSELSEAWRKKRKREEECEEEREPSDREFEMAGPLSDAAGGEAAREQAYQQSVRDLQDAWKR